MRYVCQICDWVYEPADGDPDQGVEPDTPFDDLPEDFKCPECGAGIDTFSEMH